MENIEIQHDGLLTICTGSSRKTKVWKQKRIAWSEFLKRLSITKRTPETQAEYFRMSKPRQDEIKDVGGFVGGELEDGRRTALTTISRQIITLDADFAEQNLWDKVIGNFDNAICVYSTHKHTPEKPRLRLIIPMDRPVTPDEYQAISRKVAEGFGMDNFDDTTYQPHRMMYFPSTSCDAEYLFKWQDGEFLNADKILAEYDDWQDQATWAISSRSTEIVTHAIKKAEDPLKKHGVIGAFCRAHTIHEVIAEFLPDIYVPFGHDRYTFMAGSSAGGAIVYEDKWLYSFHATDPCSLQLCNAFDLVRIHKFGNLDEGADKKDVTKLPSYQNALQFCSRDSKTRIELSQENLSTEKKAEYNTLAADADTSWRSQLTFNEKTGKILPTRGNIRIILENDPLLKNTFGYDLFSQRIVVTRPLFWRTSNDDNSPYWIDSDDSQMRYYLETRYGIDNLKKIDDEITSIAHKNAFHRVREYLRELVWDGVPRLDTFFIDYLGADDSEYVRTITRKTLIAAVGRVMQPGLKFDNMLVLEGRQGLGKSELLSKLGKGWFSDSLNEMQGKEAYESLRGYWIIEVSELEAMRKSEVSAVKKFISKKVDSYRVSYGKRTQDFPRQCVFFGTTNEKIFLKDPTGNRRFFPVSVGLNKPTKSIFFDKNIDSEIDQIWAEAVLAWNNEESIWIGENMEVLAKKIQEQHTEENALVGMIEEYLNKEIPVDWYSRNINRRVEYMRETDSSYVQDDSEKMKREKVCIVEIWCELMGGDIKRLSAYESKNILNALSCIDGWQAYEHNGEKLNFGESYGLQKAFVRII